MKHFSILLLFYCSFATQGFSQLATASDSTYVSRSFSKSKIDGFKADTEFIYGRPQQGQSFWSRIVIAILGFLGRLISFTTNTFIGKILLYGICLTLLIYVILKLMHIDARGLFFKPVASAMHSSVLEENIHELNFDQLIAQAVERKEYRQAVRLTFLHALKKLADANLIKWLPGKTNDDYLREIKNHPSLPRIIELRYYFDYAWYGHFEIDSVTYQSIRTAFQEFNQTIKK